MKFGVRKANIDPDLRSTYERYGVVGMQVVLGSTNTFWHKGGYANPIEHQDSLLPWLTEQFDRAERKENVSMMMELAIVILVAFEVVLALMKYVRL